MDMPCRADDLLLGRDIRKRNPRRVVARVKSRTPVYGQIYSAAWYRSTAGEGFGPSAAISVITTASVATKATAAE